MLQMIVLKKLININNKWQKNLYGNNLHESLIKNIYKFKLDSKVFNKPNCF